MAIKLSIQEEPDTCDTVLTKVLQSGHANFLIGSGASRPAIAVAGNIELYLNKLLEEGAPEYEQKKFGFVRDIQISSNNLIANRPSAKDTTTILHYRDFLSAVVKILEERKTTLLPKQVNVFTTNYDIFFEVASSSRVNLRLNDGFNRLPSANDQFRFQPEHFFDVMHKTGNLYNYSFPVPSVNLIKIHGSLTWAEDDGDIWYRASAVEVPELEDAIKCGKIGKVLSNFSIIMPTKEKFEQTLMQRVYYDLLRIYANTLEVENTALVSFGFSFEDEHILDITRRALRNPTLILIIMAFSSDSADAYVKKFEEHNNVYVFHTDDDSKIDFPAFTTLLNNVAPKSDEKG